MRDAASRRLLQVNAGGVGTWFCGPLAHGERRGTSGLDQGRRRNAFRSSLEAERIELGNEPPLSVDGENTRLVDRRRVSAAMVQRHHPDRSLRRSPDGRRGFRRTGWRDQFRHRAGAGGSNIARRRRRHRRAYRQCRAQERPPAACGRGQRRASGHSRIHHDAWRRQSRDRARASVHPGRRQPLAVAVGTVRQHPSVQCPEADCPIGGNDGLRPKMPPVPSRTPKCPSSRAISTAFCRGRGSPPWCRSTRWLPGCAKPRTGAAAPARSR